jgi:phage terminase Nu1 subunit (DNA packaging protein)
MKRNIIEVPDGLILNAASLALKYGVSINKVPEWEERGMPYFEYGPKGRRYHSTDVNQWMRDQSVRNKKTKKGAISE